MISENKLASRSCRLWLAVCTNEPRLFAVEVTRVGSGYNWLSFTRLYDVVSRVVRPALVRKDLQVCRISVPRHRGSRNLALRRRYLPQTHCITNLWIIYTSRLRAVQFLAPCMASSRAYRTVESSYILDFSLHLFERGEIF